MKNVKSNYDLVLEMIETYEDESISNKFRNEFKEGKNITKKQFFKFCEDYVNDMCEEWKEYYSKYIVLNWKYVKSGGDYSVFDNVNRGF